MLNNTAYKLKKEKNLALIADEVKAIYEKIRVKVVEPLTVRRTRKDLWENDAYRQDLESQHIHFPDVKSPHKIYYQLDSDLETLYDKTIKCLSDKKDGLTYNRYQAIKYLKPNKKSKYKYYRIKSEQQIFKPYVKNYSQHRYDEHSTNAKRNSENKYEARYTRYLICKHRKIGLGHGDKHAHGKADKQKQL